MTTESFYWANRIIAALADPHFNSCAVHIERYQEAVGAKGHAAVNATDDDVVARDLSYGDATDALTKENDAIAAMLRDETDKVLGGAVHRERGHAQRVRPQRRLAQGAVRARGGCRAMTSTPAAIVGMPIAESTLQGARCGPRGRPREGPGPGERCVPPGPGPSGLAWP